MATPTSKDDALGSQETTEIPNSDTNPKDANDPSTKYTTEQKMVSAVWWHEREFNLHSMEKIKKNFKKRFGIEAPDASALSMWEKKLFEDGCLDKDKNAAADQEMSAEGSDEDDGSEDEDSSE
nr:unnamed protein product [Callosobruchus chinensis]